MAVINNTVPHEPAGNGMGFLLGVIFLIIFLLVFFYYGLPALRSTTNTPQINVPGKIDVNINRK